MDFANIIGSVASAFGSGFGNASGPSPEASKTMGILNGFTAATGVAAADAPVAFAGSADDGSEHHISMTAEGVQDHEVYFDHVHEN